MAPPLLVGPRVDSSGTLVQGADNPESLTLIVGGFRSPICCGDCTPWHLPAAAIAAAIAAVAAGGDDPPSSSPDRGP